MHRFALPVLAMALGPACGGGATAGGSSSGTTEPAPSTTTVAPTAPGTLVGAVTREQIEASEPRFRDAEQAAHPDATASAALASVPPGATVTVYLGTWCGDSRREVGRFFAALDLAAAPPAFELRYVAVDRAKEAPGLTEGADVRYVPTFVVARDGREVGRIIESAPGGVESDLVALLRGERSGVVTGRTDL